MKTKNLTYIFLQKMGSKFCPLTGIKHLKHWLATHFRNNSILSSRQNEDTWASSRTCHFARCTDTLHLLHRHFALCTDSRAQTPWKINFRQLKARVKKTCELNPDATHEAQKTFPSYTKYWEGFQSHLLLPKKLKNLGVVATVSGQWLSNLHNKWHRLRENLD